MTRVLVLTEKVGVYRDLWHRQWELDATLRLSQSGPPKPICPGRPARRVSVRSGKHNKDTGGFPWVVYPATVRFPQAAHRSRSFSSAPCRFL
jgi:hypothetical protein